jgi:NAD(P)-dependent dehydrogenase (short-subunit alcohol dehydrogenase family)
VVTAVGQLDGKVALITGGESGIGLASAQLFVSEGAHVHLIGLQETKLKEAVDYLGSDHAFASVADVTDEQAVHDAIESGYAHLGRLDVLFSNAGTSGTVRPIVDYPGDVFARTLAVHVGGAFHVLKHGLPRLTDGGSVIITSSVVGLIGFGQISAYVAAKHAQVGLMRAAAKEVANRRIRVNTLHPGPTSTAFQDAIEMEATGLPQAEAAEVFNSMIPLGRHTSPEEIAQAALYLASDASAMVTSTTFAIDGGLSG